MPPRHLPRSLFWIVVLLIAAQIACQAAGPSSPTQPIKELEVAQSSTPIATTTLPPAGETSATSDPEPVNNSLNTSGQLVPVGNTCLSTADSGVICLDQAGWNIYSQGNGLLPANSISDIALCPDNSLLAAHISGLSQLKGQNWKSYELADNRIPEVLACDAIGGIWTGHFQGVSYYDGQSWIDFPSSQLASGSAANELVEDLVVAPDGIVWVATANSLAAYDGNTWRVFQQDDGFDEQYFFEKLAVDAQGRVWAAHSSGLLFYEGDQWQKIQNPDLISVSALALDSKNRPWVGTTTGGLWFLDGGNWTIYRQEEGGLSSNHIQSLAIDGRGRVWAGTSYGLSILDGERWQTYRMDNSGLGDNLIRAIVIQAGGPDLPEAMVKETGSLSGQVVLDDGRPLANTRVEICVESLGSMYFGETPCSGQPYLKSTSTDGNGKFSYESLPEGLYLITINTDSGWAVLQTNLGISSERVRIKPGENTDVGELKIEPEQ